MDGKSDAKEGTQIDDDDIGHIVGDPFALATISIAIVSHQRCRTT